MSGRGGKGEPGPQGFTWRGIKFSPPRPSAAADGFYSSETIEVDEDGRTAEWKFHQVNRAPLTATWHARLRIGADRYPGVGETPAQALEMACAEAANVATYIVAMLPAARELAAQIGAGPAPKKRRAIKVLR